MALAGSKVKGHGADNLISCRRRVNRLAQAAGIASPWRRGRLSQPTIPM
jgi:hypothetical protein